MIETLINEMKKSVCIFHIWVSTDESFDDSISTRNADSLHPHN
jgi:hypothetical protein